jgi:VIT1/CCC1 family predicted Fe2+/Mn2+ transporter
MVAGYILHNYVYYIIAECINGYSFFYTMVKLVYSLFQMYKSKSKYQNFNNIVLHVSQIVIEIKYMRTTVSGTICKKVFSLLISKDKTKPSKTLVMILRLDKTVI